jgi:plasmid stabilization system protein ParE
MQNYRLSRAAQEDLWQIKSYSLATWGKKQTQNYLAAIETTLEKLTSLQYSPMSRPKSLKFKIENCC